jgi:predicted transcriptional regulator
MDTRSKRTIVTTLSQRDVVALDRVRGEEKLSRAGLAREAIGQYIAGAIRRIPVVDPEPGELAAIARGEAAIARGEYVTLEELLHDLDIDRRKGGGGTKKSRTTS